MVGNGILYIFALQTKTHTTMSYDIMYRKQFIKVDEKNFIPMILAGSNNCYETNRRNGRERRERSWFPCTYMTNGKLFGTLDEMLLKAETDNKANYGKYGDDDKYDESMFGNYACFKFNGGYGTYNQYRSMLKTACRTAKTVEELTALNIMVVVRNSYISSDSEIKPKSTLVRSTEEMLKAIDELTLFYKDTNVSVIVDFDDDTDYVCKKLTVSRKYSNTAMARRDERRKKLDEAEEVFIIKVKGTGGYFVKFTKYGYKYSWCLGWGVKRFLTEKEAQPLIKKLNTRGIDFELKKIATKN